jgi:hypothetical protein
MFGFETGVIFYAVIVYSLVAGLIARRVLNRSVTDLAQRAAAGEEVDEQELRSAAKKLISAIVFGGPYIWFSILGTKLAGGPSSNS